MRTSCWIINWLVHNFYDQFIIFVIDKQNFLFLKWEDSQLVDDGKHSEAQLRISGKLTPTLKGTIMFPQHCETAWKSSTTVAGGTFRADADGFLCEPGYSEEDLKCVKSRGCGLGRQPLQCILGVEGFTETDFLAQKTLFACFSDQIFKITARF